MSRVLGRAAHFALGVTLLVLLAAMVASIVVPAWIAGGDYSEFTKQGR